MQEQLRQLPSVQSLLETETALNLIRQYGHADVTNAVRLRLAEGRRAILKNSTKSTVAVSSGRLLADVAFNLKDLRQQSLVPVINATGVLISTNLGRARLAQEAADAMLSVATNYSTLEWDLGTGKRGSRQSHVEALICHLTGAEAALVVNNCAAAVLASLSALARGRVVIASRGELVEIGGSFRMPDVILQSGATLKEVGSTNKTRLSDYERAVGDDTALLLKSHTSNYKIVGFSAAPTRDELVDLSRRTQLPLVEDLGSGLLVDLTSCDLPDEPIVKDVLKAGVDLVLFSGDKLLGGPQAGIIAGKRDLVERISVNSVARACRIDKLSLAALQATLNLYLSPNDPFECVPVLRSLSEPIASIKARAETLADSLTPKIGVTAQVVPSAALAGGGTLPQNELPSYALSISSSTEPIHHIARRLSAHKPPILGRLSDDKLLLDMRSVVDSEVSVITEAMSAIAAI